MARRNKLPSLLSNYGLAWMGHDIELLREIFHRNAVYHINGKAKLKGITALERYWRENELEQENVRFTIERFVETDSIIVATWNAHFIRRDKKCRYSLSGMLWLQVHKHKILSLAEYFTKTIEPI